MNEGDSAGGGHQGSSPAPPAVPDRRSTLSIAKNQTSSTTLINIGSTNEKTSSATFSALETTDIATKTNTLNRSFQQVFTHQQQQQQQKQQQSLASFSSESAVITSLSVANNHMQQVSAQYVAGVAAAATTTTTTVSNPQQQQQQQQQKHQQHILVTQIQTSTISSYATAATKAPTSSNRTFLSTTKPATIEATTLAKRFKIDAATTESVVAGAAGGNVVVGSLLPTITSIIEKRSVTKAATIPQQDVITLKKLIIEQKYLRLKSIKEKYSDHVAELFYLQSGGNMMDYQTWKKKPPSPQYINFCNAYRLDQLVNEEIASVTAAVPNTAAAQTQQTAEHIATIIGVSSSGSSSSSSSSNQTSLNQQQPPTLIEVTTKTNTQSQLSSITTGHTGLKRKRSLSTPPTAAASTPTYTPTQTVQQDAGLPQGAEIKIPAVGATPVAVSTQLPAAVVQLTQQGHIPGRPLGGRHGMVFGQIPAPPAVGNSSVPLVPGGTPLVPCESLSGTSCLRRNGNGLSEAVSTSAQNPAIPCLVPTPPTQQNIPASAGGVVFAAATASSENSGGAGSTSATNNAQEFSFKAKQEVYVMQRISELQREGLWTEKRLPKLQEPSRPKAHWDYLLEEMVWLAADFAQERKWKKNAAKKCAKMVQKYFQDKANAAQKAEKAQELHLKRIASFISKEVKMFWSNVEKLVEYKHHTKIEEKRKKALDQHLSFIVDQTEKFSQQLAEGMNKSIMDATTAVASTAPSINSSRKSSPKREQTSISDDEFRPVSSSEDDEETIAKAEEEAADVNEEVAALEKESQMDLDDFLNDLPSGYLENRDKLVQEEKMEVNDGEETDDDEFQAVEASEDDENTISQQEAEESELDHKKEIDELEADNDLTVEQLMEKYKSKRANAASTSKTARMEIDSDDDEDVSEDETTEDSDDNSDEETADETLASLDSDGNDNENGLKSLLEDKDDANKDDMIKDAAALAESIQPKGNTLSSTNVVTPVPFLLKHTLREYQHIGLDWLVTMHDRKLNGILADEMGLGKTIQTIALLAHLACVKGNWGPHLIVVPSSVMLNWEMEFKKWCPGFKILTYYGTQKERKLKRVGWTKPNAFHVCITSYKLVVQDQQSFRRKKWKYLILDEAQNIKNFKSQRWQLLLNFSTERRLLLTGTPLQNDLMELWSLMHFLMPYVFSSHREFKEWFSNPMTGMIEGNMEYNESLINRLHKVIRPFLLRRLKKEVEKQMPKKYEHVVMCRLSNRQRYLYDDFMSRSKTRETLQTGNLLSVINVLMQLRKVCNHPNMFEVRPTISPFQMEGISYHTAKLVCDILEYNPFKHISLESLNLMLCQLELTLTAYVSHKSRLLAPPRKLIEEIDIMPEPPPRCPPGKYKFHIRIRDPKVQKDLSTHSSSNVRVGASPAMKTDGNKLVPIHNLNTCGSRIKNRVNSTINPVNNALKPQNSIVETAAKPIPKTVAATNVSFTAHGGQQFILGTKNVSSSGEVTNAFATLTSGSTTTTTATTAKIAKLVQSGKPYFFLTSAGAGSGESGGGRLTLVCKAQTTATPSSNFAKVDKPDVNESSKNSMLVTALAQSVKTTAESSELKSTGEEEQKRKQTEDDTSSELDPLYNMTELLQKRKEKRSAYLKLMSRINRRRTEAVPIYGADCRDALVNFSSASELAQFSTWHTRGYTNCRTAMGRMDNWTLGRLLKSYERRCEDLRLTFANFVIYVPSVCAPRTQFYVQNLCSSRIQQQRAIEATITKEISPKLALLHPIISAMTTQFPDPRLIQYDCGKLQTLDRLLRQLKSGQHRVLIFTQMTKMLDVLEAFLNYHGHIYLRLDGSTRVEQRQVLMERFNGDKRIFCFILSTRSGGVGINLTGADTVVFYDSDWNPTMDAQAQDRCHRIGQTRDVHIYRLVSEKTIEVNILKKANQKRMLSDMAIEGGNFTTSFFKSSTIKDLFNMEQQEREVDPLSLSKPEKMSTSTVVNEQRTVEVETEKQSLRVFESALAAAEDEQDVQATKIARAEVAADLAEFDENIPIDDAAADPTNTVANVEMSRADLEVQNLVKQLSPIERYAMRFVEETGAAWTAEQLRAAEEELEAQKREWEANRQAALLKEEEMLKHEALADEMITYSRKDATNQVNTSQALIKRSMKTKTNSKKLVRNNQKVLKKFNANSAAAATKSRSAAAAARLSNRQKKLRPNKKSVLMNKKTNCRSRSISKNGIGGDVGEGRDRVYNKSGSDNKNKLAAAHKKSNNVIDPIRKTTRTSIAAAASLGGEAGDDSLNALSLKKSYLAQNQSPDKKRNSESTENAPVKSCTGVKNQKLLSISKKRRKLMKARGALALKKRKLSPTPVKREPTKKLPPRRTTLNNTRLLRNSPKKVNSARVEERPTKKRKISYAESTADESATNADDDECSADNSADSDNEAHSRETKADKNKNTRTRERAKKEVEPENSITPESKCSIDEQTTTNSNSMDVWDAHAQIHDTATTNSTYYNVSEESDTDEHESMIQINSTMKKSVTPVSTVRCQRSLTRSPGNSTLLTPQPNQIDVNSPRTRSRGSVKINLWTLDVSPVLPGVKPHVSKYRKETEKQRKIEEEEDPLKTSATEDAEENTLVNEDKKSKGRGFSALRPPPNKTTAKRKNFKRLANAAVNAGHAGSSNAHKVNSSNTNTLHRWLLKAPKVVLQQMDVAASTSGSEHSGTESPTPKSTTILANGPS